MKFNKQEHLNCDGLCIDEKSNVKLELMKKRLYKSFVRFDSKVIWCRIPKTASVSIASFLGWTPDTWDHFQTRFIINEIGKEKYDNAFKFTFVRNPLARLTSIYEYFRWHDFAGLRKGAICIQNFDQWVLMGCPHNIGRLHEKQPDGTEIAPGKNILLQKDQLVGTDGTIDFNFIGKVENINNDAIQLKNMLYDIEPSFIKGKAFKTSAVLHLNAGGVGISVEDSPVNEPGLAAKADWKLYYSIPEVLRKAQDILKEDLDLLNY